MSVCVCAVPYAFIALKIGSRPRAGAGGKAVCADIVQNGTCDLCVLCVCAHSVVQGHDAVGLWVRARRRSRRHSSVSRGGYHLHSTRWRARYGRRFVRRFVVCSLSAPKGNVCVQFIFDLGRTQLLQRTFILNSLYDPTLILCACVQPAAPLRVCSLRCCVSTGSMSTVARAPAAAAPHTGISHTLRTDTDTHSRTRTCDDGNSC